ncbi:MAG: uracil phosphoribosyltransferase [Bacteroidales bacterium]|nr:uracil phosphoribosyltransferase [Candidatus Cacconaster merdequi]
MKIVNLGESNSVFNQFVSQIRDKSIQKDSMRFRRNLERIGEIFAYEISKTLKYSPTDVETPLGIANVNTLDEQVVIASIMRAGLPIHQGLLNLFDNAQNCFVSTYRKSGKDNKFNIHLEYVTTPPVEGKTLIIADTVVATGASIEITYKGLVSSGEPTHTHIVCPIASKEGVEYLSKKLPHKRVTFWVGAIDEELTNKTFIVPGLGDAGDLAFGAKI